MRIEDKIAKAALLIAENEGWQAISVAKIVKTSALPRTEVQKHIKKIDDLAGLIVHLVDKKHAEKIKTLPLDCCPYDKLLESSLMRFEILQKHRNGIIAMIKAAKRSPSLAFKLLRAQRKSILHFLSESSPAGNPLTKRRCFLSRPFQLGYFLAYQITMQNWMEDETPSLEKTTAALDRSLSKLYSLCCEREPVCASNMR